MPWPSGPETVGEEDAAGGHQKSVRYLDELSGGGLPDVQGRSLRTEVTSTARA